jgi:hypothetical protein
MGRHAKAAAPGLAVKITAAGVLLAGAAVASAATAAADPTPPIPADPAAPVLPPAPAPVADAAPAPGGQPLGAFANYFLGSAGGQELMLGQTPVPAVPGSQPAAPPNTDVLNGSQFLVPNNYRVPTPDQESPYALPQGTPGPFARVDGLKGLHAMVHGALGRMPHDQLSEPLPGTAPPPGTALPPGPMDNLPDPGLPPAPPGLPPKPAPALLPPLG